MYSLTNSYNTKISRDESMIKRNADSSAVIRRRRRTNLTGYDGV